MNYYYPRRRKRYQRFWTSSKKSQAIYEAKNFGMDYVMQKYGTKRANELMSSVESRTRSPGRGGSKTSGAGRTRYVRGRGYVKVGSSAFNAPPKADASKHKSLEGPRVGFRDSDYVPPSGNLEDDMIEFPGGTATPKTKLNLENEEELAQGSHHQWAQPTSISSTITSLLREAQNSSANYWEQWAQDKGGQYAIDQREGGSSFGTDLRWTPERATESDPLAAFGTVMQMQAQQQGSQQAGQLALNPDGSFSWDNREWKYHVASKKFYTTDDPNLPDEGFGFPEPGQEFGYKGSKMFWDEFGHTLLPVGATPTEDPNKEKETGIPQYEFEGPVQPDDLFPSGPGLNPEDQRYNPWGRMEGAEWNQFGPAPQHMANSTLEAMSLANAYFAPQRMELAYELGDMETDMRRLAVNLGRQVDDPVLQAKLYKEAMRSVRTLDVQQNTFAFQMAEQRRREELQNFQFYDQLSQEEARMRLQNRQFYEQLELQRRYFNLDNWNVANNSISNAPAPTINTVQGTPGAPTEAGGYGFNPSMIQRQYQASSGQPMTGGTLQGIYSTLMKQKAPGGSMGAAGNVTRSTWGY